METEAFEVSFPQEDQDKVISLLQGFGGDTALEEEAIKLSAMALFLSNIASGYLLAQVDGTEYELGMDFVIEGGIPSADFASSVISPALRIQERWERNILHDTVSKESEAQIHKAVEALKMRQNSADAILLPASRARHNFINAEKTYCEERSKKPEKGSGEAKSKAISERVKLMPDDLVSFPLTCERRATLLREATEFEFFLSNGSGTANLRRCAARAHLGRMIVHASLESPDCLDKLSKSLSDIGERDLAGRSRSSPSFRMNLALSAASGVLDGVLAATRHRNTNTNKLLWLVESSPGCELPEESLSPSKLSFRNTCEREIMLRINFEDDNIYKLDALDGHLANWKAFLREQERHLPGIAAIGWNLPVSLCYGLEALLGHQQKMNGAEVIAFAKWLVIRMSNRLAAASCRRENDRTEQLATKIIEKLATKGPMTIRDLTRAFSRMKTEDCRDVLNLLSERHIVAEDNGLWGVIGSSESRRSALVA